MAAMTESNGTFAQALIADSNETYYFCQAMGLTLALAKSEGHHFIDDSVEGFAYQDRTGRWRLTTLLPRVTREHFGWGVVTDVRRDLGAFVDIGLADKDIVVSMDDMPLTKEEWPKKGDQLYIKLISDSKDRLWGHLAWQEDFWALANHAYDNMQNEQLRAIVYRNKESGSFVYLPDNQMLGFIHPSERLTTLRVGQELTARVIGYREENRTLYLSQKPRSFEMLDADGQMILAYLETSGGTMPFNDKSTPDEIQATFGISKGQFKKALGGLMKQKKITQSPAGTALIKK